ncbi:MAG: type II toxin-antitoxin system RelE/ParE family toxin [Devosia sp.]
MFLAPRAEADLDRIAVWIADQGAPITALDYIGRIRRFLSTLGQFLERGADYGRVRPGLRIVGFERRVVFAIVVRDTQVEVERVFYGGQDWRKALQLPDD